MSTNPKGKDAITAYLRRLGNPYAKLQILGEDDIRPDLELRAPTAEERAYAVLQGNQYTVLSVAIADSASVSDAVRPGAGSIERPGRAALSKADFIAESTRILRSYIPSVERGRLRQHHRHFILRNQNRSPAERYLLAQELSKYDIGASSGVEARFNRERDELTEQKLRQIEKSALEKDSN